MSPSKSIETSQQTGYQKLIDQESLNYERNDFPRSFSSRSGLLSYKVGFWVLSLLYILTAAISFTTWPSEQSQSVASYGIIDIPYDDKVVFQPDGDFEVPTDSTTEEDPWGRLEPAGRGFIEVPIEVPLPDGGTAIESQYFCISMFHQLHCIASLSRLLTPQLPQHVSDKY
ncbi:hypothetical protein EG329_002728 [Mollisiaceae sp. DMI_Dod_QoI]|nr:hypothetical protein EG329_002728 [Helotiales sp. DMI_Dod_QoI]